MTFKVTYVPSGDTLFASSEFEAYSRVCVLADLHLPFDKSRDTMADFWDLLHGFPGDVIAFFDSFSIQSFSGDDV